MHEKTFQDFGIDFEIEQQENSPVTLQSLFNKEIEYQPFWNVKDLVEIIEKKEIL